MAYNTDQTIELLQQAVAEKGDGYVYPGSGIQECRYADAETQAPSCIVGHVLDYLGLLSEAEEHMAANRLDIVHQQFTRDSIEVLRAAQVLQDLGYTWGEALVTAKDASCSSDPYKFVHDLEHKFFAGEAAAEYKAKLMAALDQSAS